MGPGGWLFLTTVGIAFPAVMVWRRYKHQPITRRRASEESSPDSE
jgi:hypothetical protein